MATKRKTAKGGSGSTSRPKRMTKEVAMEKVEMDSTKEKVTSASTSDPLMERIKETNRFIEERLEMIPAKHYFVEADASEPKTSKFYAHTKKLSKSALKKASKMAKQAKLDPSKAKTTGDIMQDKLVTETKKRKRQEMMEANAKENGEEQEPTPSILVERANSSISDLKERLQLRIQALRLCRNKHTPHNGPNDSSDPTTAPMTTKSRQEILEERQKRKLAKKERMKQRQKRKLNGSTSSVSGNSIDKSPSKPVEKAPAQEEIKLPEDTGDINFGNLQLPGDQVTKKRKLDAKALLKKAEKRQEKLELVRQQDSEKAARFEEADQWSKAMSLSQGVKVKDDLKLLRRTAKRLDKDKESRGRKWASRVADVQSQQAKRQETREANLKARRQAKMAHRKGGAAAAKKTTKGKGASGGARGKKAGVRPGFEGAGLKSRGSKKSK